MVDYGYHISDFMDKYIGLPKLIKDNYSFDLCLTNPPWSKNYEGSVGGSGEKTRTKEFYDKPIENYEDWCKSWFEKLKQCCKTIIRGMEKGALKLKK